MLSLQAITPNTLELLTYFDDAETMDMPKMHIPNTWDEMKKTIASAVKEYQS